MGALLATLSSLLWGTGDFLGGTLSRRVHPVAIIRVAHTIAAVVMVLVVTATAEWSRTAAIGWGAASGIVGAIGLSAFYAALAGGTMGVVAPIAATGVVVPVTVGLVQGDAPGAVALVGIVVTIVGVVLVSGPERASRDPHAHDPVAPVSSVTPPIGAIEADGSAADDPSPAVAGGARPLVLAGVSALAFGSAQALVAQGADTSVAMSLLAMRTSTAILCTVVLATVLREAVRPERSDLPTAAVIAGTDTGAIGTFSLATTMGSLSISAVLASLYPAVTAALAWRFHHERLRRIQIAGAIVTLAGVALIAAG